MVDTLQARMQQVTDTAANWTSNDPTLLSGEIGYESDTGKFKVGDGTTAWTSLSYSSSGGDVVGPASATDNAVPRFNATTGKLIQNSGVIIDDSNNITGVGTVDGRDLATDGTKLDGIESSADVTDETNVVSSLSGATLTAATVTTSDKVLIQDADDSDNLKTATAQSIADLAAGVADGDKGDITVSSSGAVWTIDDNTVTLAKMATMATDSFLGRDTAGTGNVEVLTAAAARTILNVADGAEANVVDSVNSQTGVVVLDADGISDAATTNKFTTAGDISKLAGIEASADVTDEANVVSSLDGATLTGVTVASTDKVIIQDVSDTDNIKTVTAQAIADLAAGTTDHGALSGLADDDHTQYHTDGRADTWLATKDSDDITEGATNLFMSSAEQTKLSGIETSADVTDEANVTAALDGATLTDVGTPASGDRILLQDNSDSNNLKYADFSEFGGGGGSSTFTGLSDTPSNYAGHAGKFAVVNSGETAIEFVGEGDLTTYVATGTGANITTSAATMDISTEVITNANFSLSTDEITVTDAGKYLICYSMLVEDDDSTGSTRGQIQAWVEDDTVAIAQSYAGDYARETSGGQGLSASFVVDVAASSVIRLRSLISSAVNVSQGTTSFSMVLLKGAQGAQGTTGATGAAGADGADGDTSISINNQTGTTYTTVIGDAGKKIRMNNASANTLTIPPNSSVAYATGTVIMVSQVGAGQTTIAEGAGVTINYPQDSGDRNKLRAQFSECAVHKVDTDTWDIAGDLDT